MIGGTIFNTFFCLIFDNAFAVLLMLREFLPCPGCSICEKYAFRFALQLNIISSPIVFPIYSFQSHTSYHLVICLEEGKQQKNIGFAKLCQINWLLSNFIISLSSYKLIKLQGSSMQGGVPENAFEEA
jgi:hypothetical protein